jgi:hypothetical protein
MLDVPNECGIAEMIKFCQSVEVFMWRRRTFALILVITLLLILTPACSSLTPQATALPSPTRTLTPPPSEVPSETPAPTPTGPQGCVALEGQVIDQMERIEDQVITLRGLRPTRRVQRQLLTPEQLRQQIIDDFLADYTVEEAEEDVIVLASFGLLQPDFDLLDLYVELYSEQVAGYYDDETETMAIVCGTKFGGPERVTYAHEFAHALQDQVFDFQAGLGYTDELCEMESERCAALQALVEGDATLLEEQWLKAYATSQDLEDLIQFAETFESPVFNTAPRFLREDFLFPYFAGRSFVHDQYLQGSWASVDALYESPPISTEQILHPERYPRDVPVEFEAPDLLEALGDGWHEIERGVLGEWYSLLMLEEELPSPQAEEAAEGWGGDFYVVYLNDSTGESALVLLMQWDTIRDTHEFTTAFREYGDLRFGEALASNAMKAEWDGPSASVRFERQSNQTLLILAPEAPLAQSLYQAVPFPARPK